MNGAVDRVTALVGLGPETAARFLSGEIDVVEDNELRELLLGCTWPDLQAARAIFKLEVDLIGGTP